jgi:hypothetical protein
MPPHVTTLATESLVGTTCFKTFHARLVCFSGRVRGERPRVVCDSDACTKRVEAWAKIPLGRLRSIGKHVRVV